MTHKLHNGLLKYTIDEFKKKVKTSLKIRNGSYKTFNKIEC